jgi:PAS domain-containing protein
MSDEPKMPVQPEEELTRLRQEVAGLQAALATKQGIRPMEGMPGNYNLLFETLADPIFVFDRTGRFVSANPAAARALGRRPEDLVGRTMQELFPAAIADRQARGVQRVFETGQSLLAFRRFFRTQHLV